MTKYDVNNETRYFKDKKELQENGLWQPTLIYSREIKTAFNKKITVPFQFCSDKVFDDEKDAVFYLGFYAQELMESGDLPKDVIVTIDGKKALDETKVQPFLKHLTMSVIEREDK